MAASTNSGRGREPIGKSLDTWSLRNISPGRKVGLLGGSFDPPHPGHLHISLWALKLFRLDQIWWLISPGNPLKGHAPAPVSGRLATARREFAHPRIVQTDLESRVGTKFSIDTLKILSETCPQARMVWLMGADNLVQFHFWERWHEIFTMVPVGVLARRGYEIAPGSTVAAKSFERFRVRREFAGALAEMNPPAWTIAGIPRHPSSSTEIRERGDWNP